MKRMCFHWHLAYEGRESCELQGRKGAPVTMLTEMNINTRAAIICTDPRLTVWELAQMLDISIGSTHTLLKDYLHMFRMRAPWIPGWLTPNQRNNRVEVCKLWLSYIEEQGDARWKTLLQLMKAGFIVTTLKWSNKVRNRLKKVLPYWKTHMQQNRQSKIWSLLFLIIEEWFTPIRFHKARWSMPTTTYQFLSNWLKITSLRSAQTSSKNWKLHQDNSRLHVAHVVQDFLTQKSIEEVPHPPYSPDLAPNDFFLYLTAKKDLEGRHFPTSTAAVKALDAILKRLSSQGFEHVFMVYLNERWVSWTW